MPIELCDRLDVVVFEGPAPHLTAEVRIYQENGKKQIGRRRLRTQRNG